jgi:hypothetical protein
LRPTNRKIRIVRVVEIYYLPLPLLIPLSIQQVLIYPQTESRVFYTNLRMLWQMI